MRALKFMLIFFINRDNNQMPYHFSPTEVQFNQKYQTLVNYLNQQENKSFSEIVEALANLPDNHILKDLFVLNGAGKSFLHLAAAKENLVLITFLKETGHDINLQDISNKTPLYEACENLKIKSVNALLGYQADSNLGNSQLLFKGIRNEEEGEISYYGENVPLVAAITSKVIVTPREFAAASMTHEDLSSLTDPKLATERARAIIVKNLLAKGANALLQTGIDHVSAFHRAIESKQFLVINEIADVSDFKIFEQRSRDGEAALNFSG